MNVGDIQHSSNLLSPSFIVYIFIYNFVMNMIKNNTHTRTERSDKFFFICFFFVFSSRQRTKERTDWSRVPESNYLSAVVCVCVL